MKIGHIAVTMSLALILSSGALASREPYPRFRGEGTKESPFLIESVDDLDLAASLSNCGEIFYDWEYVPDYDAGNPSAYYCEACYRLNGDIDCGGQYVEIFGTAETPFYGDFDGAGFAVTNVKLRAEASKDGSVTYAGLFGYAVNACIHDLGIENAVIDYNPYTPEAHAGILCGRLENDGSGKDVSAERCYVSGAKITLTSETSAIFCGGLIGGIYTPASGKTVSVTDCYAADIAVDAAGMDISAGGVVGCSGRYPTEIVRCYAAGSIKAVTAAKKNVQAGGIVGKAQALRGWSPWMSADYDVESCFADVELSVSSPLTAIEGTVCGRCISDAEASNVFTVRKSTNSKQDQHVDGTLITADKAKTLSFWRDSLGMDMTDVWYLPESGYPVLRTNAGISACIGEVTDGTLTVTVGTSSGLEEAEGRLIAALYEGDPDGEISWKKPFPSFRLTAVSMQDCTMDGAYARDTYTFTFDDVPAYGHVKVFFVSDDGFAVLAPSAVTELYETDF